jgi:hypothetical protein
MGRTSLILSAFWSAGLPGVTKHNDKQTQEYKAQDYLKVSSSSILSHKSNVDNNNKDDKNDGSSHNDKQTQEHEAQDLHLKLMFYKNGKIGAVDEITYHKIQQAQKKYNSVKMILHNT